MPYRARERDLFPDWIYDISVGNEELLDLLIEILVARSRAMRAFRERGSYVPKLCLREFKQADETLEVLRKQIVAPRSRARRAATALRKFVNAHQCARFLASDTAVGKTKGRQPATR